MKPRIDWLSTIVPCITIVALCILFIASPEQSTSVLSSIRFFLGEQLGSYYLLIGLGVFLLSLYNAFSRFGTFRLGKPGE